ncbi:MAG: sigma-70 family RNA polymerase sigma factor [Candidatus Poribacteria bacterium]|nr:sigma-70 family RNA polymerase sigma factor [Candidatus Poribacteria bacterium]
MSLTPYLNDVARMPSDKLVEGNLKLVVHIAKQFTNPNSGIDMGDLIQEGNMALMRAADKFMSSKGTFRAYAGTCIRMAIIRFITCRSRSVSYPEKYFMKGAEQHAPEADITQFSDTLPDPTCLSNCEIVKALVSRLPQKQAMVIRRHYFNGESFKEIGESEGVSDSAVHYHGKQGLKQLRVMMEEYRQLETVDSTEHGSQLAYRR